MGQLERGLQRPDAAPADVASLVARLPSASVLANRTLPPLLLRRLHRIAAKHGGRVPIYGRLFAQWLHHAYPRECPFPHLSGTTRPQHLEHWQGAGRDPIASQDEMRFHAQATPPPVTQASRHGLPAREAPV